MDAVKVDVTDAFAAVVLCDLQADRIHIITVNGDVGEGEVLDQRIFHALVGHTHLVGVSGQTHGNAGAGFCDIQVREGHIPHYTVINVANSDGAGMAGQVTVGDSNTLTHSILVQWCAVSTNNDAVITAGDITVGDGHIGTAVDMDAIVVGNIDSGADLQAVKADIEAIADPIAPATPLICHSDLFYNHIFAADEEHNTGRREA